MTNSAAARHNAVSNTSTHRVCCVALVFVAALRSKGCFEECFVRKGDVDWLIN